MGEFFIQSILHDAQDIPCETDEGGLALIPCWPRRAHNNLNVAVLAVIVVAGGEVEVKSGSGGRCRGSGSRSGSGSGRGSGGKYRRLAGRAEGTGHQPSAISRQPGVPPKRRLLWTTASAASSIDRPSLHCVRARGGIASCCGIH